MCPVVVVRAAPIRAVGVEVTYYQFGALNLIETGFKCEVLGDIRERWKIHAGDGYAAMVC